MLFLSQVRFGSKAEVASPLTKIASTCVSGRFRVRRLDATLERLGKAWRGRLQYVAAYWLVSTAPKLPYATELTKRVEYERILEYGKHRTGQFQASYPQECARKR